VFVEHKNHGTRSFEDPRKGLVTLSNESLSSPTFLGVASSFRTASTTLSLHLTEHQRAWSWSKHPRVCTSGTEPLSREAKASQPMELLQAQAFSYLRG